MLSSRSKRSRRRRKKSVTSHGGDHVKRQKRRFAAPVANPKSSLILDVTANRLTATQMNARPALASARHPIALGGGSRLERKRGKYRMKKPAAVVGNRSQLASFTANQKIPTGWPAGVRRAWEKRPGSAKVGNSAKHKARSPARPGFFSPFPAPAPCKLKVLARNTGLR